MRRARESLDQDASRRDRFQLGWLMGFEPTTTGITIQDSTAELQPPYRSGDLARPTGFEPVTPGLEGRCSIQMSYGRSSNPRRVEKPGRGGGIRTPDILL